MRIKLRTQYSLRSLLALVTIGCLTLGRWVESARLQHDAVDAIVNAGGIVTYDYTLEQPSKLQLRKRIRNIAKHSLCMDFFHSPTMIYAVRSPNGDEIISQLKHLPKITDIELRRSKVTDQGLSGLRFWREPRLLDLGSTDITDKGLQHLKGLRGLKILDIPNTRITEAGARYIQSALPNCHVTEK